MQHLTGPLGFLVLTPLPPALRLALGLRTPAQLWGYRFQEELVPGFLVEEWLGPVSAQEAVRLAVERWAAVAESAVR